MIFLMIIGYLLVGCSVIAIALALICAAVILVSCIVDEIQEWRQR